MKSYSLQNVASIESAADALREALPGQEAPWLLLSKSGDVIAYFSVSRGEIDVSGPAIVVDISGRHYHEDSSVIRVLQALQNDIGGQIVSD
jgi:hypothetical protein